MPIVTNALRALAATLALSIAAPLAAWEDHDQLTALALADEAWASRTVAAETLEAFLEAEKAGLAELLAATELRARKELDFYRPLPDGLALRGGESGSELRAAFLRSIRVNPKIPLALFVQVPAYATHTRPDLPLSAVDLYESRIPNGPFEALGIGEKVALREVIAAASDEPDYGMDIGLYAENGTEAGKVYGFGRQPFGNPALTYGSQAPFHMAFAREDPLIKAFAPFTRESLLAYRVMVYEALARYALGKNHPYWGWRFAGWAIHYIEDLSQPYHASLLPGLGTFRILALNVFGSAKDKQDALVFLSNRHIVIEDYLYGAMAAFEGPGSPGAAASPVYDALRGSGSYAGPRMPEWRDAYEYDVIARRAYERGGALDGMLAVSFPKKYVSDPSYDYGARNFGATREYDPFARLRADDSSAARKLESLSAELFADLGGSVRSFAAFVRGGVATVPPRKPAFDFRGPLYALVAALVVAALAISAIALSRLKRRKGEKR